jgi:hypothetical protein
VRVGGSGMETGIRNQELIFVLISRGVRHRSDDDPLQRTEHVILPRREGRVKQRWIPPNLAAETPLLGL